MAVGGDPNDDAQSIVDDIEDMADWADAGFETDWSCYDFETLQLYQLWRRTECEVRELRARRFDALVKGFMK